MDYPEYKRNTVAIPVAQPAAPVQEPMPDDLIATYEKGFRDGAAQRQWVGLTDEEISACDPHEECWGLHEAVRRAEAKLRSKNGGQA